MVWWGFRALKTPEERLHRRRFSVGRHTMRESVDLWTNPGQILDKHCANATTERLHVHSKRTAFREQKDSRSIATGTLGDKVRN